MTIVEQAIAADRPDGLFKLMFSLRAKPELTRAQALAHLRDRHAPLVAATATVRRRLRTYIQNHAIDVPALPDATGDRDWIVESWRDPAVVLPEPPTAADAIALREDEARFPDRATLVALNVIERPVWSAAAAMPFAAAPFKVFTYFRQADGGGGEGDLEPAWATAAATLAGHPAFRAHAAGWTRNRTMPGSGTPGSTASPTGAALPPYDGVDVWRFPHPDAIATLFADADFRTALARYEHGLVRAEGRFRLATSEHVVFDDAGIDPATRRHDTD